jgi:hypothetical protein
VTELRHDRRRVLGAGLAAGVLLVAGPTAGCTASAPEAPEGPDPLEAPAVRAEADVALAQAVAATHPALAAAATALVADRQAHATALRDELRRARPEPSRAPRSPVPSALPLTPADADGAGEALARAVHAAQDEAAKLVVTLPGYRAALLASVTACCASHAAMLP